MQERQRRAEQDAEWERERRQRLAEGEERQQREWRALLDSERAQLEEERRQVQALHEMGSPQTGSEEGSPLKQQLKEVGSPPPEPWETTEMVGPMFCGCRSDVGINQPDRGLHPHLKQVHNAHSSDMTIFLEFIFYPPTPHGTQSAFLDPPLRHRPESGCLSVV